MVQLELFEEFMSFVFSDTTLSLVFLLVLVGFFAGFIVAARRKKMTGSLKNYIMLWGGLSTMVVMFVVALLLIDVFNLVVG